MAEVVRWQTYEQVAAWLLNQFASEFGLDRVEGKQDVAGQSTGTNWQIDAKGVREGDGGFMIVECRRYTKSRICQEEVAGLAYRIMDSGAIGGIVVSPLGFQEGASKVAASEGIFAVTLDPSSTPKSFSIAFLNKFRAGGSFGMFICGGPPEDRNQG
jgi:Restriction endonuclease